MYNYQVTLPINVPAEWISDWMIGALEGGSNYWLDFLRVLSKPEEHDIKDTEFWSETVLNRDVSVVWEYADEANDDEPTFVVLNKERVEETLKLFFKNRADYDHDNFDAEDSDAFLQFLFLGDIVYG